MKMRGLTFLLLSYCVTDGIMRQFHAVNQNMSWTEARTFCRAQFSDLATIQDPSSNAEAQQVAGNGCFWIGLYNTSWRWSQGNEGVPLNNWYTSWASAEPKPGKCVTISEFGLWSVEDCALMYNFVCYNAAANSHMLVNNTTMSWADAQAFCRAKYTDLSSIKTNEDNVQISGLLQPAQPGPTAADAAPSQIVWFGLYRNFWGWSDSSSSPYRQWGRQQQSGVNCVMMESSPSSADWYQKPCTDKHSFLCYTDVSSSAQTSVRVRLHGGSADLMDPALQGSVLQQLKQKLQDGGIREEVKLRWMIQPDGQVFHSEEEEEERVPPCDL